MMVRSKWTVLAVLLLAGAAAAAGPLSLDAQRRLAERAGYRIVPAPDAAGATDAAPTFTAAQQKAGLAVLVRDYNLPIYPDSAVRARELAAEAVIEAARGETEPLSLAVHALADLQAVTLSVGPLTGPGGANIGPGAVEAWYLENAYIQSGRWQRRGRRWRRGRTAQLVPLRMRPVTPLPLGRGTSRQFWINVRVPADARPGEYRGKISVRARGRPPLTRDVTLRVRPYKLVEPKKHFFGAFMTLWKGIPVNRKTLADFKAHGIDAMLWFWNEHNWKVRRNGETIVQDFTPVSRLIDDAVAVGMTGPIVIALGNDHKGYYERVLCRLFGRPLRPPTEFGEKSEQVAFLNDALINRLYAEGVRQFAAYVKTKKHWPEISLLHYDEPTERLMAEATFRYKQIKQVAPDIRVYGVTMNRLAWAEQLAPISDILVCNGDFERIRDLGKRLNKEVWGYGGSPAVLGAGGARFNMGWRLWRYGLPGHWFWCYNFYVGDPWDEFHGRTGDANWVTVYPAETPGEHVPTLAWEGIREARDDLRYAATLLALIEKRNDADARRIRGEYDKWLASVPRGRRWDVADPGQDDFYATLPAYHVLTRWRRQIVAWIEQLSDKHPKDRRSP
jgi:hypothetical protein